MSDENQPVKHSVLRTAKVEKMTSEIHLMAQQLNKLNVISIVKMGQKLIQIKAECVERGDWLQWLEESPVFAERSAERFMQLHTWSVDQPAYFKKWADLGPSKLYIMMALPNFVLKVLDKDENIKLPKSDTVKTLHEMTVFEMERLVREHLKKPRITLTVRVKEMKSKVRGAVRAVRGIMPQAKKMDEKELMAVEREVTKLLKELREVRKNVTG